MALSDAHLMVLSAAAARQDKLVTKHKRLPGAVLPKVCAALVKRGLLTEFTGVCRSASTSSPRDPDVLHVKTELGPTEYAITPSGLAAIGVESDDPFLGRSDEDVDPATMAARAWRAAQAAAEPAPEAAPDNNPPDDDAPTAPAGADGAPEAATTPPDETARPAATTAPTRPSLHAAAQAVIEVWDGAGSMAEAIGGLRAALAGPTPVRAKSGTPRAGTKQEAVLALLRRTEGATIAQIIDATAWQSHTVRGFLAGLKRKGITVEVLERVRQVRPNKEGAKGSYSVYRVAAG